MTVELKIRELCQLRNVKKPYELQILLGTSASNARKLFNNESRLLSLEMIGKICTALHATPNDFLVLIEEPQSKIRRKK